MEDLMGVHSSVSSGKDLVKEGGSEENEISKIS